MSAETIERGLFEAKSSDRPYYDDGALTVTSSDRGVLVEVEQEKAVDSYNQTFCCACLLSREDAERLRDFLVGVLA